MNDESREERFLRLMSPIWGQLARYTRAVAGEYEAARDLMAETVAIAWEHFESLRDDDAFKRYLFRIAVRLNSRRRQLSARQVPIDTALSERLSFEDQSAERAVEVSLLYGAIAKLPEKQRETILLFEIGGLSLKEVREVQGGTLSGVKSRLERGRETLAKALCVSNESATSQQRTTQKRMRSQNTNSFLTIPLKAKL
jgi:RNA polymerase sigma-70 factor (ECF subfamily)